MFKTSTWLSLGLMLVGCVGVRDGGLFVSAPAGSMRVREGEEALAREQRQRQDADHALMADLGKAEEDLRTVLADSESRTRADINEALAAYESDPQGSLARFRRQMATAASRNEEALREIKGLNDSALAALEGRSEEQRAELTELLARLQSEGTGDDTLLWVLLGALGLGGATVGGKRWGQAALRREATNRAA